MVGIADGITIVVSRNKVALPSRGMLVADVIACGGHMVALYRVVRAT